MAHTIKDVQIGEVRVLCGTGCLCTSAIGSCIAVAAYHPARRIGGMVHAMLPGKAPAAEATSLRYLEDALSELVLRLAGAGADRGEVRACAAGGGNVLRKADDRICQLNTDAVREAAPRHGLPLVAANLGGAARRSLRLDVMTGEVWCATGDGPESLLCTLDA